MAKKLKISVSQTQTIREAFDDFLLQKKALGLADKTIETYSHHFGIISKYLDSSAPIAGLFKRPLDEMIERMRSAGMKDTSINSYTRTLKSFLSWCNREGLVKLCTDICQRNGKKKLIWLADKTKTLNYTPQSDEMVLTVHRWFANKSCPGDWLYSRLGDLASKVTAALDGTSTTTTPSTGTETKVLYRVRKTWADAKSQKGAYKILANAQKCADANPGYSVFDSNGTLVYPVSYRVHTVVHGDTLWKIAAQYLGDGSRYKEIVSLNGLTSNVIYSGMKLKIPN